MASPDPRPDSMRILALEAFETLGKSMEHAFLRIQIIADNNGKHVEQVLLQ